ncbi:MAG: HAD family hydrolase [Desulfobacteraceae bacterium]|jgi:HAD superfamily 5'-nucleotidase-like hydrolase|nr:MAG: HAD family hydrolase [Desulfobacteraceae bacterium]
MRTREKGKLEKRDVRAIFCNRTLNLRAIRAIGYDMDYTLIHYRVEEWEQRSYDYLKEKLEARGWALKGLQFDPGLVCRGLIVDTETGNLVKANRFGFVKHALHGTETLPYEKQRKLYARTIVDLSESRWFFLNTLFSLSEGCLFAQLVDILDRKGLPEVLGYSDLHRLVREAADSAHMEGRLKGEILKDPDRFVELDPRIPQTLLDQRQSGKSLLLITNSEWNYTLSMMSYAFDRFLLAGSSWKDLFDLVIVGANKPSFFTMRNPLFEVVNEEGHLMPCIAGFRPGMAYLGGSAAHVERHLGLSGDEILYVGDHMFGDVRVTKDILRWRTALILRELESEIRAAESFRESERRLAGLMDRKERLESDACRIRLELQRRKFGYGQGSRRSQSALQSTLLRLRSELAGLDQQIGPLAKRSTELDNKRWGLLMRAGNDKSHLAFQVERFADVYTSRVSNFLRATPFVYLRSSRGSLPHDLALPGGRPHTPASDESL